MDLTGYALVSAQNIEVKNYMALPNPIEISEGDLVYGASVGEVFADGSRLIPVMRDDHSPGRWYTRLREERAVYPDQVVVTVIYSNEPDIAAERAHMICSPFQGRMALSQSGMLAQVQAAVDAADEETKIAWEYAIEWRRISPLIQALSTALGMTDTQVDDLFRLAMTITA